MFEKEAEEYAIDNYENCLYDNFPYTNDSRARQQSFKDGAEFGYSKANEWHFVKDRDLPKEDKVCLLYLGRSFNPITGWINSGIWHFEDGRKNDVWQIKVTAWKEIVLPELSEEANYERSNRME